MQIKHLNSLRLFALVIIIVYHFFQQWLPGGFVGVDILFCLSGYLLTSNVIDRLHRKRELSAKNFLKKRFYRIYPSLFLMVALVLFLASFGKADFLTDISRQSAAALGSVTNWYEILTGGSYEAKFIKHYFIHSWYLAIAIHEYLFFALIVSLVLFSYRKKEMMPALKSIRFRKSMIHVSVVIIIGEIILTFVGYFLKVPFSWVYFSELTRMHPFFFGCIVGSYGGLKVVTPSFQAKTRKTSKTQARSIIFAALVLIVALSFSLSYENWLTYLIGLPLTSLLAGLVMFYIRLLYEKSLQEREDELFQRDEEEEERPLIADLQKMEDERTEAQSSNWKEKISASFAPLKEPLDKGHDLLNRYSYSIYLFHWPLFVLFSQYLSHALSVLLAILGTFVLAAFSSELFEPLIRGEKPALKREWTNKLFEKRKAALTICLVLLLLGGSLGIKKAPTMTSLEEELWAGQTGQNIDQIEILGQEVLSQKKIGKAKGCYIIGDSVLLSPRRYLLEHVPNSQVNAAASRTPQQAYELLQQKIKEEELSDVVVLCIGTNSITKEDSKYIQMSIDALPNGHRMVLVTPYNAKANDNWKSSAINRYELSIKDKYDYVTVVDWHKVASENPSLYERTDGVHFGGKEETYKKYAECINAGIKEAMSKPAKGEK